MGVGAYVLPKMLGKLYILEAFGYDSFLTHLESDCMAKEKNRTYFQLKQHIGLRKSEFFKNQVIREICKVKST